MGEKRLLCLLLAISLAGASVAYFLRRDEPAPLAGKMADASQRMAQCMQALREERERRGLAVDAAVDPLETGLIGEGYSPITTTMGDLAAKRTSATLDMAALCVKLLAQAAVDPGDTVAACFSGSFPGLCVALICACDALNVEIVYSASVGSSTYGGNLAEFTAPEMLLFLSAEGLISTPPILITPGGAMDRGENMGAAYFPDERGRVEAAVSRIRAAGGAWRTPADYADSLALRMAAFQTPHAFVSVGGHDAAMGLDEGGYAMGEGLLKSRKAPLTADSGLIARYLAQGTPVLSLLNIRALCARYGIPFDPSRQSIPYEAKLYWQTAYPLPVLLGALTLSAAFLIYAYVRQGEKGRCVMRELRPLLRAYRETEEKEDRLRLIYAAWQMARRRGAPPLETLIGRKAAGELARVADGLAREQEDGDTVVSSPGRVAALPAEELDLLARYLENFRA